MVDAKIIISMSSFMLIFISIIVGLVLYLNSVSASAKPQASVSAPASQAPVVSSPVISAPAPIVSPTPTSAPVSTRMYTFHQGSDSGGNDIVQQSSLIDNVPALKDSCNTTPGCVAFNTNGWLKNNVLPSSEWNNWTSDPVKGMYVLNQ